MIEISLVANEADLEQIHLLNQQNLKHNFTEEEMLQEGFVTWLYSTSLLLQLHQLAPSVVAKDKGKVIGYALVALKESGSFHADLKEMFRSLGNLQYQELPLFDHNFYCMGQVCIEKAYRGKGIFSRLYEGHRHYYGSKYDLLVTEISTNNPRSQQAHEKVGFQIIHTHRDHKDEWNVVVWDWRK
jgi:GNAT superfamily N-acetyltransferase